MATPQGLSARRLSKVRDRLSGHVDRGDIAGAVALVWRGGEAHVDAVGYADLATQSPMSRDTIFRFASMSKAVTAVAAMILVEETVLRLDDPVDSWLPELANRRVLRSLDGPIDDTVAAERPITLRDLLTFRFGIGAIMAPRGTYPIQDAIAAAGLAPGPIAPKVTNDQYLARLGSLPLLHQPGEKWMYHTGSDVIGVLISRATGTTFGEFLKERIFDPLSMHDTAFFVPETKMGRFATSYSKGMSGALSVFDPTEGGAFAQAPAFEAGGSGLVSTADDYLAFCLMLLAKGRYGAHRILSRPSVDLMTTDQMTARQKELSPFAPGFWETDGWGFGVSVTTHSESLGPGPGSYGWTGGFGTAWRSDPTENIVTLFLNQRMMRSPTDVQLAADFTTLTYQAIDD